MVNDIDSECLDRMIEECTMNDVKEYKDCDRLHMDVAIIKGEGHVMKEDIKKQGLVEEDIRLKLQCSELTHFITS